jgi:hypothetical protein
MEEAASAEGSVLKKGTRVDASFWVDATGELSSTAEIQAESSSLFLFQGEERIPCDNIFMLGEPLREGLQFLFPKTKIFP